MLISSYSFQIRSIGVCIVNTFGGETSITICKIQVSMDQRQRLAMSTERLNQSSDRITESRRTVLETEEIGVSILQDLHQQRETLLHSHNKVCH